MIQALPPHVRRGLLRVYLLVALPWVGWFGYQILDAYNRHPYYRTWRYVSGPFWTLLAVPIGVPILFALIYWVRAGFQPRNDTIAKTPPRLTANDYYSLISREASRLKERSLEARISLYQRARTALARQLQDPALPASYVSDEKATLEAAIQKLEKEAHHAEQKEFRKASKASTFLLIASISFPGFWAMDATSMSVYWVARLPEPVRL